MHVLALHYLTGRNNILQDAFVVMEDPEFHALASKAKECKRRMCLLESGSVLWELRALVCNLLNC